MRLAYADPPYPGCAHLYQNHPDYAGEVDHRALVDLLRTYDGFVLHTASTALAEVLPLFEPREVRVMAWVKPFAAFKRNVPVAYAWEPVLVKAARKPVVSGRIVPLRDWLAENITMKKGLTGAKPPKVCRWLFEALGANTEDTLEDLYPGTGIVKDTWDAWRQELQHPTIEATNAHE